MSQTLTPTCLRGKVVAKSDVTLRGNQAGSVSPPRAGFVISGCAALSAGITLARTTREI